VRALSLAAFAVGSTAVANMLCLLPGVEFEVDRTEDSKSLRVLFSAVVAEAVVRSKEDLATFSDGALALADLTSVAACSSLPTSDSLLFGVTPS